MVMSADSSDCHVSSESASARLSSSTSEQLVSSVRDAIDCQLMLNCGRGGENKSALNHIFRITSFEYYTGSDIVVGRSHLENALKMPPNTSASTYYQQTKVLPRSSHVVPLRSSQPNDNNFNGHSPIHSNNFFIDCVDGAQMPSTKSTTTSEPTLTAFLLSTVQPRMMNTTEFMPSTMSNENYSQNISYQPCNVNTTTHGHVYQQNMCGVNNVSREVTESRPQTPDYIKSYPVMDTTVASSVKGEPELNIGKYRLLHLFSL
ncbi:PREDICTED: ecdysone-induced protein 75B, isoforms C/D-like, partial [Rhagoletis zephyria]|uniref:ecdysone-induced protein 75B, isoforms C/D-like n=1 Tax=Rhagoletis zephyria TaxID=28612 RepID=UPI00081129E5